MLARSHVKTGAAFGVAAVSAGLVPFTEPKVAVVAGGLLLFGTLAPDLDHVGSTATNAWIVGRPRLAFRSELGKSLWRGTRRWWPGSPWLSWLLRQTSTLAYQASRGPNDPPSATPHRKLWHTAVGCVALGGLVAAVLSQAPQWGAAVAVALMVGVVGQAFASWAKWAVAVVVGVVAWSEPSLTAAWPVWWLAVSLGCAVHCAGDGCSKNGVPWLWPREVDGKRWASQHVLPEWLRFVTGGWGERVALGAVYAITAGAVWPAVAPVSVAVG